MNKKKYVIKDIQKKILTALFEKGGFMTTNEVSNYAKISWNTAYKYLREMEDRKWIKSIGSVVKYWEVIV